jgi:transcriptional regulator with XRE-family HTH domain
MTQEELAEMLGVNVDAIEKYERSVSFIRGDLERRLSDRPGWSSDVIVRCRLDWQTRQRRPLKKPYRILDDTLVEEILDGSWRDASLASVEMAGAELGVLPQEFGADADVFAPNYETFRDHWGAIMCKNLMVAKWTLPFLLPEDEVLFKAGRLIEFAAQSFPAHILDIARR